MRDKNTPSDHWPPPTVGLQASPDRSKWWLVPIIGGLLVVLAIVGDNDSSSSSFDSDAWQAHAQCAEFTRARLKSPASADFPEYDDPGVTVRERGTVWVVRSFVDSQNGFGALVRTAFTCEMTDLGAQWRLEEWSER